MSPSGDDYPYRPQDRDFQGVVCHGGGITQQPDHWGNDYFDDTYLVNGEPKAFEIPHLCLLRVRAAGDVKTGE